MKRYIDGKLKASLEEAVRLAGTERVMRTLEQLSEAASNNESLTIVVNAGVHHLAEEYRRGEIFVASEGSLDFSSSESIHREFTKVLMNTARKLKSRPWRRVYIIPFGPTTLSMQVKLLVYRICGLESIDVMNVSAQNRTDISLDIRQIIVDSDKAEG